MVLTVIYITYDNERLLGSRYRFIIPEIVPEFETGQMFFFFISFKINKHSFNGYIAYFTSAEHAFLLQVFFFFNFTFSRLQF